MELVQEIIELVESNRISSTEVADALGKKGVLPNLRPINPSQHVVGEVFYVYAHSESNWPLHEQIQNVPEKSILYVDAFDCNEKAIFGDLVAKYLMLYKKVKGIIVQGKMRDIPDIKKYTYPIWCTGYSPLGCYNSNIEPSAEVLSEAVRRAKKLNGSLAICDDSGVTVIDNELITQDTYANLELIELQEDIWSFCINTLKWNTYETVCLKKYLDNPDVLPEVLRERVKSIPFSR